MSIFNEQYVNCQQQKQQCYHNQPWLLKAYTYTKTNKNGQNKTNQSKTTSTNTDKRNRITKLLKQPKLCNQTT